MNSVKYKYPYNDCALKHNLSSNTTNARGDRTAQVMQIVTDAPAQASSSEKQWVLLLLISGFIAVLNVTLLVRNLTNPFDTTAPESQTIYIANRVANGQSIYPNYNEYPYNMAPYTPGYYLFLGFLGKTLRTPIAQFFTIGRCLSLLCTFFVAWLIFLRGSRLSNNKILGGIGAFLFLGSYVLCFWAVSSRPDLLALLFSFSGFLLYTRDTKSSVLISAGFFVLAVLTKQSYIAAPTAVFIDLLRRKRIQNSVLFSVLAAFPVAVVLIGLHLSSGGISTTNIFVGNVGSMSLLNTRLVLNQFLQLSPLTILLGIAAAASVSLRSAYPIYLIVASCWALFSSSKTGSNLNYFLETIAICSLLAPLGLQALTRALKVAQLQFALLVLFLVLLLPSFNFLIHSISSLKFQRTPNLERLVKGTNAPVLTDNARVALWSHDSFCIDPLQLNFLEHEGKWSSSGIARMLQESRIAYVVLMMPLERNLKWQGISRLPDSLLPMIKDQYRLQNVVDNFYVYVKK
jgi:hypothetical protein